MPGPGTWSAGDILTADDLNAIGVWQSYTPVVTQNVTRSATVNVAKYVQINKMCIVNVNLTCTTTGSANELQVSLPINAPASGAVGFGAGIFYDLSATNNVLVTVQRASTSTVQFVADNSTGALSTAVANGDIISFSISYETV